MRTVLKILLVAFLVLPLSLAAWLVMASGSQAKQAEYLKGETPSAFTESGPFLAQGSLVSPSGLTLKSPHQGLDCVAYRTRVAQKRETYSEDSDGNDRTETASIEIFQESKNIKDLVVQFEGGTALLDMTRVHTFYQTFSEELDEAPPYVAKDKINRPGSGEVWFSVSEDVFTPGQTVFVAAVKEGDGHLGPHPQMMDHLVIYPGTREQCAADMEGSGRSLKIAAVVIVVVSLLISGVLAVILKVISSKSSS